MALWLGACANAGGDGGIGAGADAAGDSVEVNFDDLIEIAPDVPTSDSEQPGSDADGAEGAELAGSDGTGDAVDVAMGCSPVDCNDDNACTTDACKEGVCTHGPGGPACSDGDACTVGDKCADSVCLPGQVTGCEDGSVCTVDSCNAASGCSYVAKAGDCSDGDICTVNDACKDGVCQSGINICDDGNPCTKDSCKVEGGCVSTPAPAPCQDGNPCTADDTCDGGVCLPGAQTDCTDGNVCTSDSCDIKLGGCQHANNSLSCDDGDSCSLGDKCDGGECKFGKQIPCNDGNACTDDVCNAQGQCAPKNSEGGPCQDGNGCTANDKCGGGVCLAGAVTACNDSNVCTVDYCDFTKGCVNTPVSAACDDGSQCTINDVCTAGICGGKAKVCDDANPCSDDTCDEANGCVGLANTASCTDGNACTLDEACLSFACTGGAAKACDDGNPCTDDSCDKAKGCVALANSTTCSDGDACTSGDKCAGAACLPGPATICDDSNPCTTDSCDKAAGCLALATAQTCTDGNACTADDVCADKVCKPGAAKVCDDGNLCTDDICDQASGCATLLNGLLCNDGNACTTGDMCSNKVCLPGPVTGCDDSNPCTTDACDSKTGCAHSVKVAAPIALCDGAAWNSSCYKGFSIASKATWKQAEALCVQWGGHLVSIASKAEDAKVFEQSKPLSGIYGGWIGCTDEAKEGTWKWTDGTPFVYSNWQGTEPNNQSGVEHYARNSDDGWNDLPGNAVLGVYICERALPPACDDSNACTINDGCTATGKCTGVQKNCDDANACTADACDVASGCKSTALADGTACAAGSACTAGSCKVTCGNGKLDAGEGCDDGNTTGSDGCGANCQIQCASGTADCDANPSNLCEAKIASDTANCGGCGKACNAGEVCTNSTCAKATCTDSAANGNETDVDCGGTNCPGCAGGKKCGGNSDCASLLCTNQLCVAVKNLTVTNTNDSGVGSLRQAILDANATPQLDKVVFAIATGAQIIKPTTTLPNVVQPVAVDGSSQPGFAGTNLITIDGSGVTGAALNVNAPSSSVRFLTLVSANNAGLYATLAHGLVVDNVDVSIATTSNQESGIYINSANGVTITNCKAAKRAIGLRFASCKDVVAKNNDLTSAGTCIFGQGALHFTSLGSIKLAGGLDVSGNTFGGNECALSIVDGSGIHIADKPGTGVNVVLEPTKGAGAAKNTALLLTNLTESTVSGVDLSQPTGLAGMGIRANACTGLKVTGIKAQGRTVAVRVESSTDTTVKGNDFSNSGHCSYGEAALTLAKTIKASTLPGGLDVANNNFAGCQCALMLQGGSNVKIAAVAGSGVSVALEDGSGAASATGITLRMVSMTATSVDGINASQATGFKGNGIEADGCTDLSVTNVKAQHRVMGLSISSGTDVTVMDNDFSSSGNCDYGQGALHIKTLGASKLPGGLKVSGNLFTGASCAASIVSASDLHVAAATGPGVNFVFEKSKGGGAATNIPMALTTVSNSTVADIDVSLATGKTGHGLSLSSCASLTVTNVVAKHRAVGIRSEQGTDITLKDNDLTNSGDCSYSSGALQIKGSTAKALQGGLAISGNKFAGVACALAIDKASDVHIAAAAGAGVNVVLESANGAGAATSIPIYLSNVSNASVRDVDLSLATGMTGSGVEALSCNYLKISKIKAQHRVVAVRSETGKDVTVTGNDLSQSGSCAFNSGAVHIKGSTADKLPAGLAIDNNNYAGAACAVSIQNVDKLVVAPAPASTVSLALEATCGAGEATSISLALQNVTNFTVSDVDFSRTGAGTQGTGLNMTGCKNGTLKGIVSQKHIQGISVNTSEFLNLQCSKLWNNSHGLQTASTTTWTTDNLWFKGNVLYGVNVLSGSITVTNAFWGTADGPKAAGGTGDTYSGSVTATPFAAKCPSSCGFADCAADGCTDKQKSGQETDIDCGGPSCGGCLGGLKCSQGSDCASKVCTLAGTCATSVPCGDTSGLLSSSPFPMAGLCLTQSGLSTIVGPHKPTATKVAQLTPTTNAGFYGAAVIGANGKLYAGGADKLAYFINQDGTPSGKYTTDGSPWQVAPALSADGTLYVGTDLGALHAFATATGAQKWVFKVASAKSFRASPTVAPNGTVYVGNDDNNLYAIKPDGTKAWSYLTGGIVRGSAAVAPDGTIYIGSGDKKVHAVKADGSAKWQFTATAQFTGSVVLDGDGTLYAAGGDGLIHRIAPDGTAKGAALVATSAGALALGPDGTLYDAAGDGMVYAFAPCGIKLWGVKISGGVQPVGPPIVGGDGLVYLVTGYGSIHAFLPKTGVEKWNVKPSGLLYANLAMGADGTLWVGDTAGALWALRDAAACSNSAKDGTETDADCGGGSCKTCATGKTCGAGSDCKSGVCGGGKCAAPQCGDGVLQDYEQCDDGNASNGDGCAATCLVEASYACSGSPSVCALATKCTINPCKNGGTCTGDVNTYACTCATNFGGTNCDKNIMGTWAPGLELSTKRTQHNLVLLNDGRAIAIGGLSATNVLASADIFNPVNNTSTAAANAMTAARVNHRSVVVKGGKVVVAFGSAGAASVIDNIHVFDPATNQFDSGTTSSPGRINHTVTALDDGRALVVGGSNVNGSVVQSDAVVFDPAAKAVKTVSIGAARRNHAALRLASGKVLVTSGQNTGGGLTSGLVFDPADDSVKALNANFTARAADGLLTQLGNGKVLITGGTGDTVDVYDPAADTVQVVSTGQPARLGCSTTLLKDGRVLIAGGQLTTDNIPLSSSILFDPSNNSCKLGPNMPLTRRAHLAFLLDDGRVLLVGGLSGTSGNGTATSTATLFVPGNNSFAPAGEMVDARTQVYGVKLNDGRVWMAGGYTGNTNGYLSSTALFQ